MKKAIINLGRGTFGWVLSLEEGDMEILNALYGSPYESLTEEGKCFEPNKSFEEALVFVEEIAKGMDMDFQQSGVSRFVISQTWGSIKPIEFQVDLRNSLWQSHLNDWLKYNELIDCAQAAFEGKGPRVVISTAPKKEIRYGKVEVKKGEAHIEFYAVWDSSSDLVPDECPEHVIDEVVSQIEWYFSESGFYEDSPIGADIHRTVTADSLEELWNKIDLLEDELIQQEQEHSKEFQKWLSETMKQYGN